MSSFLANVRDQRKEDDRVRHFTVDQVLMHPKEKYTVYKINLLESPLDPSLPPVERTVWKRYRDIRKLYENLVQLHANLFLPGKLPDFPKAKLFGRFEDTTVEERRAATEKLLQFIANFPIICRNPLVQSFFSRSEFPPTASEPVVDEYENKPSVDVVCAKVADSVAADETEQVPLNIESDEDENSSSNSANLARNIQPWWVENDDAATTDSVRTTLPSPLQNSSEPTKFADEAAVAATLHQDEVTSTVDNSQGVAADDQVF